jgi:hypothetical protein
MEPIEFVKAIKDRVIENDLKIYSDLLDSSDNPRDPIWKGVLPIYKALKPEQKKSFLQFLRLIQVNSVSHLFGILDGSTYLDEARESFILRTESSELAINGNLLDLFLETEEG